ncbi:mechanosensitive ion channel domain-containing protein [Bacillus sp. 165]|uniref:mechanosensitive ion channel family protein n=1 Tax=Bacillus sp. 165 TaxID=1529117 RepID=UPI001ADB37EE|nr:mechanosensitive ion channel domain-containing protein [Bacillus sp. 165]MBO9128770.1 mechanosensitive ion channel [Bacillus sp. 165]
MESLLPNINIDKSDIFNALILILILYIIFYILQHTLRIFFKRATFIEPKRAETIQSVFRNTIKYLLFTIILLLILRPFVNVGQLLLAGGIIGTIVGFGAQSIIKDFLYGFFFLFEGQFRKGDFVHINDDQQGGTIEELGFRAVSIRLLNGKLMTVPNGEVRKVVNGNVLQRRIFESVIVDFKEDPEIVKEVLEKICDHFNILLHDVLLKDGFGEPIEAFSYWGLSSLDSSPYGYKFSIAATIKDTDYVPAVQQVKMALATTLREHNITLAEVKRMIP